MPTLESILKEPDDGDEFQVENVSEVDYQLSEGMLGPGTFNNETLSLRSRTSSVGSSDLLMGSSRSKKLVFTFLCKVYPGIFTIKLIAIVFCFIHKLYQLHGPY